jgi:hypothetical protein
MSRRNRNRGQVAVKARMSRPPAGGVSFTSEQVGALLQMQPSAQRAALLPRPSQWATVPFGPGQPLPPAPVNQRRPDTGRAEPRLFEYPISTNINIATAPYVPWRILQEAADIPLFRKCFERRKGICRLDYAVTVDPKAVAREAIISRQPEKDVEKAMRQKYTAEITRISDWLEIPDRGNGYDWGQWTSLLMENRLKYDATVVYPRRTYGGDVYSFEVIDGKTIKPLLDDRGGRPLPPNPFCQQIMYGFPRGEFIADAEIGDDGKPFIPGGYAADQLLYERTILRPETPYGMSATEIALLDGILWMRRMGWLIAEYTEGVMPSAAIETADTLDWNEQQWQDWQRALNDHLGGNTEERLKFPLLPPGTKAVLYPEVAERYKPDMDMFLIKLVAGDFGLTATELGFPEVGSLGASFHEGEEDVLNRVTRIPDAGWVAKIATRLCVRQLAMPPVLRVQILGLESEDEAAADAVAEDQVRSARMTLNQDNERRGMPPYNFAEADMPMLMTPRGIVFLEGASAAAPPGTMIEPATAQATASEDEGQDGEEPPPGRRPATAVKAAASEARALRKWLAKGGGGRSGREFECRVLTEADAARLGMQALDSVIWKADDGPKARAGRGLAGTGTRTS